MTIEEAIEHAREVAEGCPAEDRQCAYQHNELADWLEKLKAYKATGLTPEEIVALRASFQELKKEAVPLIQAKIEGRLVMLPCSMENPVYVIARCKDVCLYQERETGAVDCPFEEDCPFDACEDNQVHVFETTIPGFFDNENRDGELHLFLDNLKFDFTEKDIGKTVFLTREEAEAAMAAQKEKKG